MSIKFIFIFKNQTKSRLNTFQYREEGHQLPCPLPKMPSKYFLYYADLVPCLQNLVHESLGEVPLVELYDPHEKLLLKQAKEKFKLLYNL